MNNVQIRFCGLATTPPRERASAADLALMVKAVPLFRRLPGLAHRLALMQAREGQRAAAVQTLTVARKFAAEPAVRAELDQLLAVLTRPVKPPGPD